MGSESTYSECETFTDEDTGTLVPPECLDAAEEPGHGALLLLPGRCVPTRPAGRGRRGPWGVPVEPEPAEAPWERPRGRLSGAHVPSWGGFDWRSGLCRHGLGFRDAARDSLFGSRPHLAQRRRRAVLAAGRPVGMCATPSFPVSGPWAPGQLAV